MARRAWTVVLVADDSAGVRQIRLSSAAIRIGIALCVLLLAVLTALAAALLVALGAGLADRRLAERNAALTRALATLDTRVDTLQQSLDALSRQDEFYRLLAGLEPMDSDMLLAGVGGPDGEAARHSALFAADPRAGRQAYATGTQVSALLRRARLLSFSWREAHDTLLGTHNRLRATPSIAPTRGYISSVFSRARWHPSLERLRPHTGIDIVAPYGAPVVASARGRVTVVGHQGEYGLMIEIDHGYGLTTRYAHLSRAGVRVGQQVERGAMIGHVGRSGLATGPHLHYEVLVNGTPADPRLYIMESPVLPN